MTGEPYSFDIALDQLEDLEQIALDTLHMEEDDARACFDDSYDDTRTASLDVFSCKAAYCVLPIEAIEEGRVCLESGATLEGALLPRLLAHAEELALYAASVHGFEKLSEASAGDPVEGLLYGAWGAGASIASHRWIKREIEVQAQQSGLHAGRGWVPGEGGLEMALRKAIFSHLDPSLVGAHVKGASVQPAMTICGFMGLSHDSAIEQDGNDIPESSMA